MARYLVAALCAVLIAAAPATRPTTQPSLEDLIAIRDAAEKRLKKADEDAIAHVKVSAEYQQAKTSRDALEAKLVEVRRTGTAQAKLDASHDFVAADTRIKRMEQDAVRTDPAVAEAEIAVQQAIDAVDARKKEIANAILNDPMNVAVKAGKLLVGMTEDQAERAFKNRPMSRWSVRPMGGDGMAIALPAGELPVPALPSSIVFNKVEDDLGRFRRVTFRRVRKQADGGEFLLDYATVTVQDGKVTQVFGN